MTANRTATTTADAIADAAAERIAAAEYAMATAAINADAARRRCGAWLNNATTDADAAMRIAERIAAATPLLANGNAERTAYAAVMRAVDAIAVAMAGGGGPIAMRIAYAAERAEYAATIAAEYAENAPARTAIDADAMALATTATAAAMRAARVANAERTTAAAEYTADRRTAERIAAEYATYTIAAANIAAR